MVLIILVPALSSFWSLRRVYRISRCLAIHKRPEMGSRSAIQRYEANPPVVMDWWGLNPEHLLGANPKVAVVVRTRIRGHCSRSEASPPTTPSSLPNHVSDSHGLEQSLYLLIEFFYHALPPWWGLMVWSCSSVDELCVTCDQNRKQNKPVFVVYLFIFLEATPGSFFIGFRESAGTSWYLITIPNCRFNLYCNTFFNFKQT